MGDMKKPSVARSRIVALSLAAAAVAFAPAASYAQDAQDKPSPFGGIGKFFGDIAKGVKQGVQQELGGKDPGEKIVEGVQNNLTGQQPKAVGYVKLTNNDFLTFFPDSKVGYKSHGAPLPAKPTTPQPIQTLIPAVGKNGAVVMSTNNVDEFRKAGLLVEQPYLPPGGVTAEAGGSRGIAQQRVAAQEMQLADGTWYRNDDFNCNKVWHLDGNKKPIGTITGRSDAYFNLAAVCTTETQRQQRGKIKPAGAPTDGTADRPAATGRKTVGAAETGSTQPGG